MVQLSVSCQSPNNQTLAMLLQFKALCLPTDDFDNTIIHRGNLYIFFQNVKSELNRNNGMLN